MTFPSVEVGRQVHFDGWLRMSVTDGGKVQIGNGAFIGRGVRLVCKGGALSIGERCHVGDWTTIVANQSVSIGEGTLLGERVSIRDQSHRILDRSPVSGTGLDVAPIDIGRDVWIGAGAVVLKGVTIGEGAVIGANSVANRDVDKWCVAVGAPLRVVRQR